MGLHIGNFYGTVNASQIFQEQEDRYFRGRKGVQLSQEACCWIVAGSTELEFTMFLYHADDMLLAATSMQLAEREFKLVQSVFDVKRTGEYDERGNMEITPYNHVIGGGVASNDLPTTLSNNIINNIDTNADR